MANALEEDSDVFSDIEETSPRTTDSPQPSPSKKRRPSTITEPKIIKSLKELIEATTECPEAVVQAELSEQEIKDFPEVVRKFPNLTKLFLHGNQISVLTDKIKSNSILELDLSNNEIHIIPEAIANFRRLRKLNLTGNSFDFGNLEPLGALKHLRELSLNYCYLSALPEAFATMAKLQKLELAHNEFKEFPPQILQMKALKNLNLDHNKIDKIPIELAEIKGLFELRIQGNPLSEFPEEVRTAFPNLVLEISIPNKVVEGVFIGDFLCASNRNALKALGITRLISVLPTPNDLPPTFDKALHMQIPLEDEETSNILPFFPYANDFIQDALADGQKVLVHCAAGVSRSASVVVSYLMKSKKVSADVGLKMLKKARPIVNPNPGFLRQLKQYEKALNFLGDEDPGAMKSPRPGFQS